MKSVRAKPISELLRGQTLSPMWNRYPFFYSHRNLFNPTTIYFSLIVLCSIGSFFLREALIVLIGLVTLAIYLYSKTKALANGLFIERIIDERTATEFDKIKIGYEIKNRTPFQLDPFVFSDYLGISKEPAQSVPMKTPIKPNSVVWESKSVLCDGGMGTHEMGPTSLVLRDSLGLFEFEIFFENTESFQVFPRVEIIPDLPVTGSPNSPLYGGYDVPSAGISVNFSGIRPYKRGDSLRHIAWKLSAKKGEFLVKQFEKSVNSQITVVLDMDPILHFGIKSDSTWEMARDLTLSLVSQQIEIGNSVQLITNNFISGFGSSEFHMSFITQKTTQLEPFNLPKSAKSNEELLELSRQFVPNQSTLFYISPFSNQTAKRTYFHLSALREVPVTVHALLIDIRGVIQKIKNRTSMGHLFNPKPFDDIERFKFSLESKGIKTYILKSELPIGDSLLKAQGG